ncbi:MAG: response regulator [Nannocystaceae bacterium]
MQSTTKHSAGRLPLRVLVVDDDPMIRRFFRRVVGRLVETVEAAADGQEALDRVIQSPPSERPDLVLSDLAMPRLNGIDLAKRLRALDVPLPVVMVTAYDPPELKLLLQLGVIAGLLPKPTPLEQLREQLEHHVPTHRLD